MKIYKIILILFLLSQVVLSQNFWMQTNGPTGGKSYFITFAPNNDMYSVGGYDHIYRSTNDGLTWSQTNFINNGAYRYRCYSFAVSQNGNLIAGGGDNIYPGHHDPREGIFRSTDNGTNWTKMIDAGYSKIVDFAVLSNGFLFAARDADIEHQSPGGIYRTSDNGNNWNLYLIPPLMIADEGIECIAADNSGNVYAGTTNSLYGYFYSGNFGATWSNRRDFYFTDIAVNQNNGNIFAIKPNDGIYRSVNEGLSWVKVSGANLNSVNTLWINSSGTIFARLNNTIYYSNNEGTNWLVVPTPGAGNIQALASKTIGNIYIGTDADFIYKTTNNGINWSHLSDGTINSDISAIAVNRLGRIFAAKNGSKIYYSDNNGENWNLINSSIDSATSLAVDTINYVYAVRNNIIYRSIDNGITWNYANTGLPLFQTYKLVYAGMDGNIYAVPNSSSGIYRTFNHGTSWQNIGLNFPVKTIAVSNLSYVYAYVEGSGLFRTTNAGANWFLMPGQFSTVTSITTNSYGYVYLCTGNSGVLRSVNYGTSWFAVNNGLNVYPHQIITNSQNQLFAVSTAPNYQSYFYRSLNNGSYWESMNAGWGYNQYSSYIVAAPSGYIYAKAFKNYYNQSSIGIWRTFSSTNSFSISGIVRYKDNSIPVTAGHVKALKYYNGQVYTLDSAAIQSNGYYEIPNTPGDTFYLMAVQDDEEDMYYVPTYYPSAIEWQNAVELHPNGNMTDMNINVFRMVNLPPGNGKIGGGVYLTADYLGSLKGAVVYAKINDVFKGYSISQTGGQYTIDNLPPGNYEIICDMLGIGNQNKYITLGNINIDTADFIFHYGLIGVQNQNNELPRNYFLGQNYPNPFNPITKIKFSIPNSPFEGGRGDDIVKLVIYDILGKEIATLVNKELKPGNYEVNWNSANYSSGIYFYRLITNDFTDTKKMVVIK